MKFKNNSSLFLLLLALGYLLGYKTHKQAINYIYLPLRNIFLEKPYSSVTNKYIYKKPKLVTCPSSAFQLAYFGQSNSANSVKPKVSLPLPTNLFQYDWQSRKCYEYKEPLIGTTGYGGNVITYTAIKLSSESERPVIIIPFGKGGTSVFEWAYGNLSAHHNLVLENIKVGNLSPQFFLWHQGESDKSVNRNDYRNALQVVLNRTRQYFPDTNFGIALATRCQNLEWKPVREAQKEIIKINRKTFLSADSDKIFSNESRYDSCHFSDRGAQKLGEEYYKSIKDFLN